MVAVHISGLTKRFGAGPAAVNGVTLDIEDGEFLTLLGPSGCGKSTLLRMLAGLETPSAGEIHFAGRPVNHLGPAERNIAMVFQSYALYPHMTVAENLGYPLKKRGVGRADRDRRIVEVAEMLKLDALLARKPRQLSGGQQQRVALGRAMIRDPAVYLFDEPLSNLDASLRAYMRSELIRLHAKVKATMVFVTHDQVEAMTMSTRIAVMEAGAIRQFDTPEDVYDQPKTRFVSGFVGTPGMNFIDMQVACAPGMVTLTAPGMRLDVPDPNNRGDRLGRPSRVTVGIRAEDILPGQTMFGGEITVVEALGNAQIVTMLVGDTELIVATAPRPKLHIGERLECGLRLDKLHFFAPATGERIDF
jgi:multiple sugar transport system ATP-binding protein